MRYVVKLTFSSLISIGAGDVAQGNGFHGIVHSDTLFSAIANEWVRVCEDRSPLEGIIERLSGPSPPFKISSAFPFFGGNYYLPTPLGTSAVYREKLHDQPFLELFDFMELASGNEEYLQKRKLGNPLELVISPFTSPRVAIDRFTATTNIYQTSGYRLNTGGGLYFILEINDLTLLDKLFLCIRLLGESGLGGEKSVGYGHFTAEFIEAEGLPGWRELFSQTSAGAGYWYSLSLCCPKDGDEARQVHSYNLLTRKGWIFSNSSMKQMKRRQCRMFGEGALFMVPVTGKMVDVTPDDFKDEHKVYRYGLVINTFFEMVR